MSEKPFCYICGQPIDAKQQDFSQSCWVCSFGQLAEAYYYASRTAAATQRAIVWGDHGTRESWAALQGLEGALQYADLGKEGGALCEKVEEADLALMEKPADFARTYTLLTRDVLPVLNDLRVPDGKPRVTEVVPYRFKDE